MAGKGDIEHSVPHDLLPGLDLYEILKSGCFEMKLRCVGKKWKVARSHMFESSRVENSMNLDCWNQGIRA